MRPIPATGGSFEAALERLSAIQPRAEFVLQEAPAPQRLAPFTVAMTADMADPESDLVSGRFVLLHDPDGVDEWEGSFRAVVFVRAELEGDQREDELLHDVGWSWVTEALAERKCSVSQVGGTVTRTTGRSFGTMGDRPVDGYVEIRASWTPSEDDTGALVDDIADHAGAWLDLMAHAAGMPPVPVGVTTVHPRRVRTRG